MSELAQIRDILTAGRETPATPANEAQTPDSSDSNDEVIAEQGVEAEDANLPVDTVDETVEIDEDGEQEVGDEVSDDSFNMEAFSVKDLASQIEVDPADIYNGLEIKLSDGAEPVKLSTLKDTFQEMNREKVKLESKITEMENSTQGNQEQAQVSDGMIYGKSQLSMLEQQYSNVNWAEEERVDPGNAALMKQKFTEQYNMITGGLQQLQQYETQQKNQALQNNFKTMYEIIPEWHNNKDAERADKTLIRNTLNDFGFSDRDIDTINNPLVMKLAREFSNLKRDKSAAVDTVNKVRKAPKTLRGKGGRFISRKVNPADAAVARAKENPNKANQFQAVKALLGGKM